jgi:ribosomal protein S18 acetylase RimI-like enzyme
MADQAAEEPTLVIRRATHEDVPAIVRLLADDELGRLRESADEPLPRSYFAAFEAIDRDPRHELVVVERAGEVIGTLQLTFLPYLTYRGGMRAQIEAVRVDRRHRDLGIGQRLFTWAIGRARSEGCHLVQLTTNASRGDAHRFYERLGFVASHVGMKLDLS